MQILITSMMLLFCFSFSVFAQVGNTIPNKPPASPTANKPFFITINTDEYYTWFHGQVHSVLSEHGATITIDADHGEFSTRDLTFKHVQSEISNAEYKTIFSVWMKHKVAVIRLWRISSAGVRTFPTEEQLDVSERELLSALRTKAFVKPD